MRLFNEWAWECFWGGVNSQYSIVSSTIIILNEIYLTFENLKGLDLLLYTIGMFGNVYSFSSGKAFFLPNILSLTVSQFQASSVSWDVLDIVLIGQQSDGWIWAKLQQRASILCWSSWKDKLIWTSQCWAGLSFFAKDQVDYQNEAGTLFNIWNWLAMWAGGMEDDLDVNSNSGNGVASIFSTEALTSQEPCRGQHLGNGMPLSSFICGSILKFAIPSPNLPLMLLWNSK